MLNQTPKSTQFSQAEINDAGFGAIAGVRMMPSDDDAANAAAVAAALSAAMSILGGRMVYKQRGKSVPVERWF